MNKELKNYVKSLDKTIKEIEIFEPYKIDSKTKYLKKVFDIAYKNKLFSLYKYDAKLQDRLKLKLFEKLSAYSGSLSFLAIQILAANSIMKKNNFKKKEFYFKKKCGIAINHLRVPKTLVKASKCDGGYFLNGTLTWASGYKIFDRLLIGFHYDNKEYEVLAKFQESRNFRIINTPLTFVGQSLNTVNVRLNDFFVKDENIVSSQVLGNYTKNKSLSKTIHYALYSLGKASLKECRDKEFKKYAKRKLKEIKEAFLKCSDGKELDRLRIKLFNLVQNIITTAMVQKGGKSILSIENLQRYYKEIIMFNSNGLNNEIKNLFKEDSLEKN